MIGIMFVFFFFFKVDWVMKIRGDVKVKDMEDWILIILRRFLIYRFNCFVYIKVLICE